MHIKAYFEHFHPSFPLLHHPTFSLYSTPKLLVQATTIIGSLFTASSGDLDKAQSWANWRRDEWQDGQKELRQMVCCLILFAQYWNHVLTTSATDFVEFYRCSATLGHTSVASIHNIRSIRK
jgi:hypothetical protein